MSTSAPFVRFEHRDGVALGIGEARPRLSWSAPTGAVQVAYELAWHITSPDGIVVDQGAAVVEDDARVLVPWPAAPLPSRARAAVRVRLRDAEGVWGEWSEDAVAERALDAADWEALLIGPAVESEDGDRRPPLLRADFTVPGAVKSARLHLTAHGLVRAEVNGARTTEDTLLPGWTPYQDRLRVHVHDVTDLVRTGANAIGIALADGWYRGRFGFEGGTSDIYGSHIGALVQLEIETDQGSVVVASDGGWRTAPGPLDHASLYDGERYDARFRPKGWSDPGFDDESWDAVVVHDLDKAALSAPDGAPVRCTEELHPVSVTADGDGWLIDYGQNHAGRPRLSLPALPAGTVVTVRHAEVLQDGTLCVRPLREAPSVDQVVSAGEPLVWEPDFTIHGYRYAHLSGIPAKPEPGTIVSRVLHTDMRRIGWFECSDPELNRLHENVRWSLRSNFVDIPTDCPQRDERLGWTGDIQAFAPTAAFLYDVQGMLVDWLRTLSSEQERFGHVPVYVPWIPGGAFWRPWQDIAGWGDAATLVPLALYQASGDAGILARQYPSAKGWVDHVEGLAGESRVWDEGLQLGDWLDPTAPPENPMEAVTDPHLVATAYFARSAAALAEMATVLGLTEDAERYAALAAEVRAAFIARYRVDEAGAQDASADTQTAYALAIAFDIVTDADARARIGDRLAQLVRDSGYTVATGFAGTPLVTWALSATGHVDVAYGLLQSHEAPSWLSTIDRGATTIWERWDSMLESGDVNPGDMTSFNHYALGSVADWMHRVIGGLAPAEPGYRRLRIAPRPGGTLTRATVRHLTPFGPAEVAWTLDDATLTVAFEVPAGTSADVDIPGAPRAVAGPGYHEVVVAREDFDRAGHESSVPLPA
ncbi:alpha-L-rhamnosidase [Demequina gelatinilytica]|uniref:alpha-L-rhamnosidase n=1 Tax=Demequina gelatinilytica TaxID=1638980 RepID=UPI0007827721|nr:alpha-L-rhamnosidase [Demequina gelatinilytica]